MSNFSVTGRYGRSTVHIEWTTAGGFSDPTGETGVLIAAKEEVCATPTGPCFAAADQPGHVALLTALAVLDEVIAIAQADDYIAVLEQLAEVPEGAVS